MQKGLSTWKAILAIFLGIAILIFAQGTSGLVKLLPLPEGITNVIFGCLYVSFTYLLIKLLCTKVLHTTMADCRITKPKVNPYWIACAIILPVGVSAILLGTPGNLVNNHLTVGQISNVVVFALFVVGLGAGVVEEMVFRGVIMTALERRWGKPIAILVPSVIFGLGHAIGANMNILDLLLLFVAGTSVGIMFSLIVYQSGSIWPSAVMHGIWNVMMIGGILDINAEYNADAIFSYELSSDSFFLTGGAFGVEASIIAVCGYISVIFLTLFLLKRKSKQ